jgi:hypothetical protein
MNFKTTYILFGGLVAVLVVLALTQTFGLKKPGQTAAYVLPSLNKDNKPVNAKDFDTVEIQRRRPKEETLLFVRKGDGWEMRRPYPLRADGFQVDTVIREVAGASKEKADLVSSLKEYELDNPAAVVTLRQGADKEWKLNLGRQSPGPDAQAVVYVTSSDRSKEPMAVKRTDLEYLFKSLDEFRAKDLLEASAFNTTYVNLQQPKQGPVILEKTSDRRWRFEKPAYGEADFEGDTTPPPPGTGRDQPAQPITGVKGLLEDIGGIKVESNTDFGPPDASDSQLAQFGLEKDRPAFMRIEIKRTPGGLLGAGDEKKEPVQDALLIGNLVEHKDDKKEDNGEKKEDKKDDKPAADKPAKRYVRLESEKAVAKVAVKNPDLIAKVVADPSVLRNRNLVEIDQRDTDAIDLKNSNGLLKLRKELGAWKLFAGSGKGRSADDPAVQGLLAALTQKRQVQSFPDAAKEADMGFDKPEAVVVSLWVNGIQKEEKNEDKPDDKKDKPEEKKDADAEPKLKDAKPTVKLTFGKEEKDAVYVRREVGSDKTLVMVPKTVMAKVNQGPLAYLDRNLPSFSETAEVTSLVLQRGGETFEVDKESGVWKIKEPKEFAGRSADAAKVEAVIRELRGLRAETLVAEGMVDLEKYGLKAPQVKATIKIKGKDDKPEEWVYTFGKETDDKTGVYAKQDRRDLVFAVRPDVLTTVRSDLLDPTVFSFDVNKVKGLKLFGWKQAIGFTFGLELERKDASTWTVKLPPDFDLDRVKAEEFLVNVANLKAERFVLHKGGPQPEHKLGKDAALQIEITLDGEKATLTLALGDVKDKAYFAQSSTLPGAVFVVPQDRFEQVLSGPKYFSKPAAPPK